MIIPQRSIESYPQAPVIFQAFEANDCILTMKRLAYSSPLYTGTLLYKRNVSSHPLNKDRLHVTCNIYFSSYY